MIRLVKRKNLDVEKYNTCIANSIQSRIYAYSWYLDIAAENWDVLIQNDYEAVMPLPWKSKFGFKYVYTPFWLLELGIFSKKNMVHVTSFLNLLKKHFKYVNLRLNTDNYEDFSKSNYPEKQMQKLLLNVDFSTLQNKSRKDRRKDLQKAKKYNLKEKWVTNYDSLIHLFKHNVGKRTPYIKNSDYKTLEKLIQYCLDHNRGEVQNVYDLDNNLVAAAFFLKNKETVTILVSSTDFRNRNNGANTFLIDRAIYKYCSDFKYFHFGGSSIKSIAKYFKSFGAETYSYNQLEINNLPWFVKLFKS